MSATAATAEPADALFESARDRHRDGQFDDAARLYERVLAIDPNHGPALHLAGMLAFERGDPTLGMARLERALATGTRNARLLEHYGVMQLRHGSVAAGIAALREGLALEPDAGSLWFNLGVGERQAGQVADAAAAFARAAPLLGTADAEHALGLALQDAGRPTEAASAYARALARDPHRAASALNAGVIAQQDGDLPRAIALYRQALASDPALVAARANLAAALHESGETDAALTLFRAILDEMPASPQALNGLGATLLRLGDGAAAQHLFERALALDPFDRAAGDNLTKLLLDQHRAGEAVARRRAAAQAHPADARAWLGLARVLARTGDFTAEADALARAVACDPACAQAHHRLGDAAQRRQDWAAAAAHYREAARLAPGHPDPWLGLALTALKAADGAAALAACDAVLTGDRFDQSAIAYRALALRQLGRDAEADWLTDLVRLVTVAQPWLDTPDLDAFAHVLRAVRNRTFAPAGQSIRGGTQTQDDLFNERAAPIQAFRAALDSYLDCYLAAREACAAHPFLGFRPERLRYNSWSVVLGAGGYHVPHIHPTGCISGVFYVAVPPSHGAADAGCLELGRPGLQVPLPAPPPTRIIHPKPGMLVLFPSYLWHGTRPFTGPGERITIAFDVLSGVARPAHDRWA